MSDPIESPNSPKEATFSGKLELDTFTCADGSVRRSMHSRTVSIKQEFPPPSPTKRKADASSPPSTKRPRNAGYAAPNRSKNAGYAPPAAYAHLPQVLPDSLAPNLDVMFVGLNPGVRTAQQGHAYAHPSNHFWRLLHRSGLTTRLCLPEEDGDMPRLFGLGLTNIVGRPSRCGSELSKGEMDGGVGVLEEKARKWRPAAVCLVGKGIWDSVERVWRERRGQTGKRGKGDVFEYGWQEEFGLMAVPEGGVDEVGWKGARVFVATSTSGLAAGLKPAEKERIWTILGDWVNERRKERGYITKEVGEGEVKEESIEQQEGAVDSVVVKEESALE